MPLDSLLGAVVGLFAIIHLIEIMAYLARIAGVRMNFRATAYTLQNAVFMLTRFFSMCFLPILGYLVDIGVPERSYLTMMSLSLLLASLLSFLAVLARRRIINAFGSILQAISEGKNLGRSLVRFPIHLLRSEVSKAEFLLKRTVISPLIFWQSAIVFSVYSLSILFMFYLGLIFPDYRMTISQLSGITNAVAAVLLTFVIEPRISLSIDLAGDDPKEKERAIDLLFGLLLGRIVGVGLLSQAIVGVTFVLRV